MDIAHFLAFWNQHNTLIIEVLVGVVILLVVLMGFKFIASDEDDNTEGLPARQLEQLENVLKNFQGAGGSVTAGSPGETPATSSEETKKAVLEKDQQIKVLQEQVQKLEAAVPSAEAAAAASSGNKESEKKIKDLEERLSEYEIISEDIADLSKFRTENQQLKSEIAKLKGGAPEAAAEPAAQVVAEEPAPTVVPTPTEAVADPLATAPEATVSLPDVAAVPPTDQVPPTVVDEALAAAMSTITAPPAATIQSSAPVEPEIFGSAVGEAALPEVTPTPVAAAPEADTSIDDDLMKEFAAAVEQQKSTEADPTKTGEPEELKDREELMGQFEKFVNKG